MPVLKALSRESSIFLLTSIFNNSIHSSIAVFHLEPQIHEKWKGRIAKWQPRKRAARKRAARKSSSSLAQKQTGDAKASPSFIYAAPLQNRLTVSLLRSAFCACCKRLGATPAKPLHSRGWPLLTRRNVDYAPVPSDFFSTSNNVCCSAPSPDKPSTRSSTLFSNRELSSILAVAFLRCVPTVS
jgi:hypothetical protein